MNWKQIRFIVLLFLFVAVIHSAIILNTAFDSGPSFQKYLAGAEKFIAGSIEPERISDFSPLYLQLHIIAKKIFRNPVPLMIALNIAAISMSSVFLFLFLRFFFSMSISLTGILMFVFSPGILIYEKVMEPEPLQILFITGMLYFLYRFLYGLKSKSAITIFLSGSFFGLTLLTRSSFFPLLILIPIYLYYVHPAKIRKEIRLGRMVLLFLAIPVLSLGLIIIQNYKSTGHFSYYYQNPGYILFEGNNPNSRGQSAIYPPLIDELVYEFQNEPDVHHKIYRMFARRISQRELTIPEVNKFWSAKAFNYIVDNPVEFIKKSLIKLHYFFHDYRRHDVREAYVHDKTLASAPLPFFPFWILSALAIAGFLLGLKKISNLFPVYAVFGLQVGVLIAGYVSSRQRVSVMMIFVFFACYAIDKLTGKRSMIGILVLLPLVTIPLLLTKNDYMNEEEFLWHSYSRSSDLWTESRRERDSLNYNRAKDLMTQSLILTPWMEDDRRPSEIKISNVEFVNRINRFVNNKKPLSHSERLNRGILFYKTGQLKRSEIMLKNLSLEKRGFKRDFDHSSRPEYWLGLICIEKGDNQKAEEYFREALEISPGSPFSLSYLFALTGDARYERNLIEYFDKIDACYFIGRAFLRMKMYHNAVKYLSYVYGTIPEFRKGNICYAVALAGSGDKVTSYNIYLEVLKKRREPVLFETETIEIFRSRVEKQPDNGVAYYFLGQVYEQYGYFNQALDSYIKSEMLMGEKVTITKKIDQVKIKISKSLN